MVTIDGTKITVLRGDTFTDAATLTTLGDISGRTIA